MSGVIGFRREKIGRTGVEIRDGHRGIGSGFEAPGVNAAGDSQIEPITGHGRVGTGIPGDVHLCGEKGCGGSEDRQGQGSGG